MGISPMGLTIIPNVSVIIINRCCLKYGGNPALGAFGCISYLTYIIGLIIQGIDDGAQPLISSFYGCGKLSEMKKTEKKTMFWALIISTSSAVISALSGHAYGIFMGTSEQVADIIQTALRIFAIGIPFAAVSRTLASDFYASGKNLKSYLISYSEPFFILIFSLFLPDSIGLNGIWWAYISGQFCVFLLAVSLQKLGYRPSSTILL